MTAEPKPGPVSEWLQDELEVVDETGHFPMRGLLAKGMLELLDMARVVNPDAPWHDPRCEIELATVLAAQMERQSQLLHRDIADKFPYPAPR